MRHVRPFQVLGWLNCAVLMAAIPFAGTACSAQTRQTNSTPNAEAIQDLSKNPALVAELGKLAGRLQREVTLPAPREQSAALRVLPDGTEFYFALPNYGDTAHQALGIFEQELQASPALRSWWQKVEPPARGMKVEDSIEKFYEVSQYLGDEVVVSGAINGSRPKLLVLAQIRKPGLGAALQKVLSELPAGSNLKVRILDPEQLTAVVNTPKNQFLVLVRPDWVVASTDVDSLRDLNAEMNGGGSSFASSAFGERVAEEYKGGATMVGAADLHTILGQIPHGTPQGEMLLQKSGFADMEYAVWKQERAKSGSFGDGELTFTGPRHGVASWLAAPGPIGGFDFVSPNTIMATGGRLKDPAGVFDDLWEMLSSANPNACTGISAFEQMLGVNLRDDLFGKLSGEITMELDGILPKPAWRVTIGVKDAAGLQQTLNKLFTAAHVVSGQTAENGITYYTIAIPSRGKATEITYAYVPGYMVLSSGPDAIRDAIAVHRNGTSLGKSAKFVGALPSGYPSQFSWLTYQDPTAMTKFQLQRAAPGMTALLPLMGQSKPSVLAIYGRETSIRAIGSSASMDAGGVMIAAAIAIPNLLRSKIAADQASAAATVRTIITAEMTYASTYPYRGYAPDLATLGRNPNGPSYTADHAALLDATIANPTCGAGAWCTKAGFRFTIAATCNSQNCSDFAVTGTPVAANSGARNFCATSDGVIRVQTGSPLTQPVSPSECRGWPPAR